MPEQFFVRVFLRSSPTCLLARKLPAGPAGSFAASVRTPITRNRTHARTTVNKIAEKAWVVCEQARIGSGSKKRGTIHEQVNRRVIYGLVLAGNPRVF